MLKIYFINHSNNFLIIDKIVTYEWRSWIFWSKFYDVEINKEITVLFGGARALLMHAAHPLIAAGARQTSFYQEILEKTYKDLILQNSVTFGTKQEADDSATRINRLHEVIKGQDPVSGGYYDALDHEQLLWVHACLQLSSIYFMRKLYEN